MLVRIRETEGGFHVSLYAQNFEGEQRTVTTLPEAFALRDHAVRHGSFPQAPKPDPEVRKGGKK